jgi:hypothetical protein
MLTAALLQAVPDVEDDSDVSGDEDLAAALMAVAIKKGKSPERMKASATTPTRPN